MSVNVNNFSISGVNPTLRFGKGGGIFAYTAGSSFGVYDSTGTNLATVSVANATAGSHAVTQSQLYSLVGSTALTGAGALSFANGTYSLDTDANFVQTGGSLQLGSNVNVTGTLTAGILNAGNGTPSGELIFAQATGTNAAHFQIQGESDTHINALAFMQYGVGFTGASSRGSIASPAPSQAGDYGIALQGAFNTATGSVNLVNAGQIDIQLDPNGSVSASSTPALIHFRTTPNLSTSNVLRMTLASDGGLLVGSSTLTSQGTGSINVSGGYYVNGTAITAGLGTGSVTSVALAGSDGINISGSPITNAGTISLTLGDITPTSVTATGTVSGTNLSGTNTGDQTITLTGGVTGSGTGSIATTVALNGSGGLATSSGLTLNFANLGTAGTSVTGTSLVAIQNGTSVLQTTVANLIDTVVNVPVTALRKNISSGGTSQTIGTISTVGTYHSVITRVVLNVGTAFTGASNLTITDGTNTYMGTNENNIGTAGVYVAQLPMTVNSEGQVISAVFDSAPTAGQATVSVTFELVAGTITYSKPYAYVPNQNGASLSIVDISAGTVSHTLSLDSSPIDLAMIPGTAYVCTLGGVVDVVTIGSGSGTYLTGTNIGGEFIGIATTPDGSYAYTPEAGNNTLYVIDTATNAVGTTITLPGGGALHYGIAISPLGNLGYVGDGNNNCVYPFNPLTNTAGSTISFGGGGVGPQGLGFSPNGSFCYVCDTNGGGSGGLQIINTTTGSFSTVTTPGPIDVAFTPDGSYAYVTNGNDTVSIVNTSTGTLLSTTINLSGSGDHGIAITPDGSYAVVTNGASNTIDIISIATNTVVTSGLGGFNAPRRVAIQ